ncbi:hypothetical protein TTHERM_000241579 (macronuclear) [Tetrahymena thermophila SB210]|uniref:Uncharacterized protein n=1 Tax=Tetrahymena thermophila (strain SB210) TaxID=312017 RepID=W7XDB5_TETTS|nr:hypothetical protein TTHERM_000241579 [Tetrahymena thermophila SB210]EWS71791.1 hypothetical protein TTHERM_000241579 [Tetrahymena thermophila SB210]|eukprot:XP_012655678.1 hypothetical protein TTHERM_000241579 [Tetrahymena thermophila SB210]
MNDQISIKKKALDVGIEPTTLRLTAACSNQLSQSSVSILYLLNARCRDRTYDLAVNSRMLQPAELIELHVKFKINLYDFQTDY